MTEEVKMEITEFRGEYAFLANFYKSPVLYDGIAYPCVECAFQAQKCADRDGRYNYSLENNPVRAKMMGKKEKLPPDWDTRSVEIMEKLLRAKFSDPALSAALAATGDAVIVEGNRWHDNKWGRCTCDRCRDKESLNLMGNLLMKIRNEIIAGKLSGGNDV